MNSYPLILDDSRKANEKTLGDFIYNFSGGRSKGRGSTTGSQQEFTWNNILISTGEASLTAYAEQKVEWSHVLSLLRGFHLKM